MKRKAPLKRTGDLKRKTPLRSKRETPRRTGPARCASRGCKTSSAPVRLADGSRLCRKHATARADDAARAFCKARDPRCVACGRSDEGVQWAHVHSRGMTFIRWDADNAVGLCARCHFAYTKRPAAWVKFVERTRPGLFVRLLHRELYQDHLGGSVDLADVIATYASGEPWNTPEAPGDWRAQNLSL